MHEENVEYLLTDDSFVRWIQGEASDREEQKWNQWLKEDPARSYKVQQAKQLYTSLKFKEELPDTLGELNRLRYAVANHEKFSEQSQGNNYYWVGGAVVAALLIILPLVLLYSDWHVANEEKIAEPAFQTVHTGYGQIQNLTFPDGSVIALNANSSLTYPSAASGDDVEMELKGEAYFSVAPKTGTEKRVFSVRTPDGTVTVLGTQFNVNTRKSQTAVVLEEGSVYVEAAANKTIADPDQHRSYTMSPGELAWFSSAYQDQGIKVKQVDTALYTSWRNMILKFEDTPLWQIAERIEQTYGISVVFADNQLREHRFSGTAPNKNLSVLLEGLSTLLDEPITEESDKIVIGR